MSTFTIQITPDEAVVESLLYFDYILLEALLLEDGLDIKFYTTDNFQDT